MAKRATNRREKGNPPKRGFPFSLWTAIGVGIALVVIALVVFLPSSSTNSPPTPTQTNGLRCAIVDQLYTVEPNQTFIEHTTRELESFGFAVDVYQGDEVTVDFYRRLPTYGYKLIIFRVHAGLLQNEAGIGDKIWLFTSQPYNRMQYFIAQLRNQVRAAGISTNTTPLFAVSSKFVTDCMQGNFSDTVIINMGCAAFHSDEMAQAFIEKGASAYLAWDVSVGLHYVDDTTMTLVDKLCSKELTIAAAVSETMKEKGPDPNNNAFLYYYPQASADKTVRELIE